MSHPFTGIGTRVSAQYHLTDRMDEWNRNPFVSALGPYMDDKALKMAMSRNPFVAGDLTGLPPHLREVKLSKIVDEAFVSTTSTLQIGHALQKMLFVGLMRRDPNKSTTWKQIYESGANKGKAIDDLPWSSQWADGYSLQAMTGMGKTHNIKRYLQLVPQVIDHGPVSGMPWTSQVQLVWLHVDMSFDGTLGGFLLQIVSAVDVALGTNYRREYTVRGMTVQKLQVHVIDLLQQHFIGILVIDELQRVNTAGAHSPEQVAIFFLRLMNAGIPTIFAGAPNGFQSIATLAQSLARLKSAGDHRMYPYELTDVEWSGIYVPKMWEMTVLAKTTPLSDDIRDALNVCSGGVPRYLNLALMRGQEVALASGAEYITADMIYDGYHSDDDQEMKGIIGALVDKNPVNLFQYADIPVWEFVKRWGMKPADLLMKVDPKRGAQIQAEVKAVPEDSRDATVSRLATNAVDDVIDKTRAKVNRVKKRAEKRLGAKPGPTDSDEGRDISKSGYAAHLAERYLNEH